MIAAELTGRQGVLLEIDPAYVDVIVRRWEDVAGGVAMLAGEGCGSADVTRVPAGHKNLPVA
jgi:hypothetical protein